MSTNNDALDAKYFRWLIKTNPLAVVMIAHQVQRSRFTQDPREAVLAAIEAQEFKKKYAHPSFKG